MSSKIYRIIIILTLSIIIINFSSSNINADEFALGEETTSYYAQNKLGHKIHFSNLNDVNFDSSKQLILIFRKFTISWNKLKENYRSKLC